MVPLLKKAGEPCECCRISVLHGVVLPIVFLVTMAPAALRWLTRSSHVVLGWFLTVLMIISCVPIQRLHPSEDGSFEGCGQRGLRRPLRCSLRRISRLHQQVLLITAPVVSFMQLIIKSPLTNFTAAHQRQLSQLLWQDAVVISNYF